MTMSHAPARVETTSVLDSSEKVLDSSDKVSVTEYTDPICSWAWGSEPKLRLLRWRHGHRLNWRTVMGGLVGDATRGRSDWDPVLAAKPMQVYWRQTNGYTAQPYPMPMHRMARSTDPAGRAVKAALNQGPDIAERVLRRLRESTFLFGVTPFTAEEFAEAARGVPGLDVDRLVRDFDTTEVAAAYLADWEETRRPNDHVRFLEGSSAGIGNLKHSEGHDRYAFPTLIMRGTAGEATVPGWMPFDAYVAALECALPGSTRDPRPDPTPQQAFDEWGVLTATELAVVCGGGAVDPGWLPTGTVAHYWGNGAVYFTPDEARARELATLSPVAVQSLVDLFGVSQVISGQIGSIQPDEWENATPCEDWNVRALVNHIVGGIHMVTYGLHGRAIGPDFYGDHLGDDPTVNHLAAVEEMREAFRADAPVLDRTLSMPWGPCLGSYLAAMFAADHVVHAWDLAQALGRDVEFDQPTVRRAQEFADAYVPSRRGPGMFGDQVLVSGSASAIEELVAFVGRKVPGA